jgi:CRP/FNR family transcriptional regulator
MDAPMLNDSFSRRIAQLKNIPLFSKLTEEELNVLLDDFELKQYNTDEIIFHKGDTSRDLYVIFNGRVRIFKPSPGDGETTIEIFSSHSIIGEFAAIDAQPRSASGRAMVKSELLVMTRPRFLHHMQSIPNLAIAMTESLVDKLRKTTAYAEDVVQYDGAGRLLYILLRYNEQFGQEIEKGRRYILDLSMNQADLASLVGARQEWVNRLLRDWRRRGLIEFKAGKLTILALPRVEAERDSRMEASLEE